MKVLRRDPGLGTLLLQLDSLDDLWAIRTLVQPGDIVTADTVRTAESAGDKLRDAKMEKRRMRLGVRAESVEWHDFDDHLRVLGPIVAGPQDITRHHTLILRPDGMTVEIHKPHGLERWHDRVLTDALAASNTPQVLLLAIDDAEAQFAFLKSYGIQMMGSLPSPGQGKRHPGAAEAKRSFYDEAIRSLRMFRGDASVPLVVVGPGWWREEFLAHARDTDPGAVAGAVTEGTSQGGRAGIHEAVHRGTLERVATQGRVTTESRRVEEVLQRIARGDGTVAYGPAEVERAVAAGAVQDLLVSDALVREGRLTALLRGAEAQRAGLHIIGSGHEAGTRLWQMGGLAATLRFPLEPSR